MTLSRTFFISNQKGHKSNNRTNYVNIKLLVQVRQYYLFNLYPWHWPFRAELHGHGRSAASRPRPRPRPAPTLVHLRPRNPADHIEVLKVATFPCYLVKREEPRRGRCGPEVLLARAVSYTEKRGCDSGHQPQGQCFRHQVRPSVAQGGS